MKILASQIETNRENSLQGVAFAVAKPKADTHNARESQVASCRGRG
jgi:hypothetical protein